MVRVPYRGVPKVEVKADTDPLRAAFEKWARGIGFEDFEVKDEDADYIDLEYCDDDVEVAWCVFVEGAGNG
jgi:uncharacterized caspase-like protein